MWDVSAVVAPVRRTYTAGTNSQRLIVLALAAILLTAPFLLLHNTWHTWLEENAAYRGDSVLRGIVVDASDAWHGQVHSLHGNERRLVVSTAVLLIMLYLWRRFRRSTAVRRVRARYLCSWLLGWLLLSSWVGDATGLVVQDQSPIANLIAPIPLLTMWTAFIAMMYVARGDASAVYQLVFKTYAPVWIALIGVVTVLFLGDYVAWQGTVAQFEASDRGHALAVAESAAITRLSTDVSNTTRHLGSLLDRYRQRIDGYDPPRDDGRVATYLKREIDGELRTLLQQVASARIAQQSLRNVWPNSGDLGDTSKLFGALPADWVGELVKSTDGFVPQAASPSPGGLAANTNIYDRAYSVISPYLYAESLSLNDVDGLRLTLFDWQARADALADQAEMTERAIRNTSQSLGTFNRAALVPFIWLSIFYTLILLIPWMLLFLFLFRKRNDRAAQIYDDLKILGGTPQDADIGKNVLLRRVLPSLGNPHGPGIARTLADAGESDPARRLDELALQAFSNREYTISLLLLTVGLALGTYFAFFPGTHMRVFDDFNGFKGTTSVSVVALLSYLLTNPTPLTYGVLGALFFILNMLWWRYVYADLYPAAFLQAAIRIITIFLLSLILTLLVVGPGPYVLTETYNEASDGASPDVSSVPTSVPVPTSAARREPSTPAGAAGPTSGTAAGATTPVSGLPAGSAPSATGGGPLAEPALPPSGTEVASGGWLAAASGLAGHSLGGRNLLLLASVLAFFGGIVPNSLLRGLLSRLDRMVTPMFSGQDAVEAHPVNKLDGVNLWTESRLAEEQIESIQGLVNARIELLVLRTHFPTARIVDWMDQAILYQHAGQDDDRVALLKQRSIRTAYDLVTYAGCADPAKAPEDKALEELTTAGGPGGPGALTALTLKAMCTTLRLEHNYQFIRNFHEQQHTAPGG